jgi:hypothetical protein
MSWIKRNLYFLIGSLVALMLMGLTGWYLYSKWQLNNEILEKLNQQYAVLQTLNTQSPHPGSGEIDNIKAAREQQSQLRDFIKGTRKHFQAIPSIPPPPEKGKLSDQAFSTALSRTIDQLQRDATNSSVTLPVAPPPSEAKYSFSFETEKQRMQFQPGSLDPLSVQLGEVKAICDVLFQAKINSLDSLRRERVTSDEAQGPQSDFLGEKSATNDMGVLTPYELNFRCFTPELAAVLAGFANSPYAILVRSVNVDPALETGEPGVNVVTTPSFIAPVPPPTYASPTGAQPPSRMSADAAFRARYGLSPRAPTRGGEGGAVPFTPQPVVQTPLPQPGVTPVPAGKGGLQTVLDEKQLKITMMLVVVKMATPSPAK